MNQILKLGRTAGLYKPSSLSSQYSPHLRSPGPFFVVLPTMPFCFPQPPWTRAFSSPHSVLLLLASPQFPSPPWSTYITATLSENWQASLQDPTCRRVRGGPHKHQLSSCVSITRPLLFHVESKASPWLSTMGGSQSFWSLKRSPSHDRPLHYEVT